MRLSLRLALALAATWAAAPAADAAFIVQYEMFGEPGDQTSTAPTTSAAGATGVNLTRGPGLSPNIGNNSMNSAGWGGPSADDFYSFGFDLNAGFDATVESIRFATRSSGTGPGFVNVFYSADGGPETLLATITQSGTAFSNNIFDLATPVEVSESFRVILRSANNTSANGGTVGSAGTLRIGDYSPDAGQTFDPIRIDGDVSAELTAVPEPSGLVLAGIGVAGLIGARRRRLAVTAA
ncbi:MAG TPA: PEP-CTERM sorting domain-containing protein [Gemmata sp.]|nr:PEP-CTERM sorting domain-containing protein [Gemmata sp.]